MEMEKYEIIVAGNIKEIWDDCFEGWFIDFTEENLTKLTGNICDQSELYGKLTALRNMGLKLLRLENLAAAEYQKRRRES